MWSVSAPRCCHATPSDDEETLTRITPEADFAAALKGTDETVVGRPCEGRSGAYWALLGPDIELLRTEYDVEAAAKAELASGQPSAERVTEVLLRPPTAEEWTVQWESVRCG